MPNDVVIRVSSLTKQAEASAKALRKDFAELVKATKYVGFAFSAFAASGILLGRSFIGAANQAGITSEAMWKLQDSIWNLKVTIGEQLIQVLSPLADALSRVLDWVSRLDPMLLKVVVIAGAVVTVLAAVLGSVFLLVAAIPGFVAGLGVLSAAFGVLSIAMGPITLIVLGITAAIVAGLFIWRNWDSIMESVRAGLGALDMVLGGLLSRLGLVSTDMRDNAKASQFWGFILRGLGFDIEETGGAAESASKKWNLFGGVLTDLIAEVSAVLVVFALKGIREAFQASLAGLLGAWESFKGFWVVSWVMVRQFFIDSWASVWEFVQALFDAFAAPWLESWTIFKSLWAVSWAKVRQFFINTWGSAWTTAQKLWESFKTFWMDSWEGYKTFWMDAWEGFKGFWIDLWEKGIKQKAIDAWNAIKQTVIDGINFVIDKINGFIRLVNNIRINIPVVRIPLDGTVGGGSIGFPQIPELPRLARGGRMLQPGVAMVGEQGPELVSLPRGAAVSPLGQGGIVVHYHQNAPVYGFLDFENQVAEAWRNVKLAGGFRGV